MKRLALLTLLILSSFSYASELKPEPKSEPKSEPVTIVKVVSLDDPQASALGYFHNILALSLEATKNKWGPYKIEQVKFNFAQARSIKILNVPGALDILHTIASPELEKTLLKVDIPLLDGMMGKRALMINENQSAVFENISPKSLKKKIACQGDQWRDSDILEANGYSVYRAANYLSMLEMLAKGRCDYFPRGVTEITPELAQFDGKFSELAVVKNTIFTYEAPVFFYLGKHNEALTQRIKEGLELIGGTEKLKEILSQSAEFQAVQPLLQNPKLRVIQLN